MSGFTKGPWCVETPMGDNTPWIVEANKASYEWRCIAMFEVDDGSGGSFPRAQTFANARLMAAAPDLYEALLAMLNHSCVADACASDKCDEDHQAERLARAALAKTEGGA